MADITYLDKDKTAALGSGPRTWRDDDANEVKNVVNNFRAHLVNGKVPVAQLPDEAIKIGSATDYDATGIADGYVLYWDETAGKFRVKSSTGSVGDVTLDGNQDVFLFNKTNVGGAITLLLGLNDQEPSFILSAPTAAAGTPLFRKITDVLESLPDLEQFNVGFARGGIALSEIDFYQDGTKLDKGLELPVMRVNTEAIANLTGSLIIVPDVSELQTVVRGTNRFVAYVREEGRSGLFDYVQEANFVGSPDFGISFPAQDGGYWVRRLENRAVTPAFWGGLPNTTTSAHAAIKSAIESGYSVETKEDEVYFLDDQIVITDNPVKINRLKIKVDHTSVNILGGSSIVVTNTPIKSGSVDNSITIKESDIKITLDDTTGIEKGDLIRIFCEPQSSGTISVGVDYVITTSGGDFTGVGAADNNVGTSFTATGDTPTWTGGEVLRLWDYDPRPGTTNVTLGEVNRVLYVDVNDVYLDIPLMDQYASNLNLKYEIYRPNDVIIENLEIISDQQADFGGISISYSSPKIKNINLDRVSGRSGISLGFCYCAKIISPTINNGYYSGTSTSYGIQDNGSTGSNIGPNGVFIRNRRGVDFSGTTPSRLGVVSNSLFVADENSGSGIGTHGGADLITFENNTITGGTIGIQLRSGRSYVKGNNFKHNSIISVFVDYADNVEITDNSCIGNNVIDSLNQSCFIQINPTTRFSKSKPLVIARNSATGLRDGFLRIAPGFTLEGLRMHSNDIVLASNSTSLPISLVYVSTGTPAQILQSYIKNNNINAERGIYSNLNNATINLDRSAGDVLYQITEDDLVVWGGAGNITNKIVDVKCQSTIDGWVTVDGKISFDVITDQVNVKLNNLQRSNFGLTTNFISLEGNVLSINTLGELYIGDKSGDVYNTYFQVGSYDINFYLRYKIRSGYEY